MGLNSYRIFFGAFDIQNDPPLICTNMKSNIFFKIEKRTKVFLKKALVNDLS